MRCLSPKLTAQGGCADQDKRYHNRQRWVRVQCALCFNNVLSDHRGDRRATVTLSINQRPATSIARCQLQQPDCKLAFSFQLAK
uniref:Uncharacterized protein n=1 Tax=Anguilla anguilla TaxID=7936 RepID=A0A0E9SUS9_ANGAN